MAHDHTTHQYPDAPTCTLGARVERQPVSLPELGRRELTIEERMLWGTCPVCQAQHGERCNGMVGIPLGRNVHGEPPKEGAHLARLAHAPRFIRLIEEF